MLVSVYLPTKNRVKTLQRALHSLMDQTYSDLEILVVNDGSTDATGDFLESKMRCDRRIIVIHNKSSVGAPAARNQAIRAARGSFVTGLDDDDAFTAERISAFVAFWKLVSAAHPKPSCLYAQDLFEDNGNIVSETRKASAMAAHDLFCTNGIGNQVFAPRAHFIGAGLFREDLPAWQDLEFFIRLLQTYGPARLVDAPTYRFDVSRRSDRISMAPESQLRKACHMVTALHAGARSRKAKQLRLQLFRDAYDARPRFCDWQAFLGGEPWPSGLLQLARASLRPGRR